MIATLPAILETPKSPGRRLRFRPAVESFLVWQRRVHPCKPRNGSNAGLHFDLTQRIY